MELDVRHPGCDLERMKRLPAVLSDPLRNLALELLQFDGVDRVPNRDAIGYHYVARFAPDAEPGRITVIFSGTVYGFVKLQAFGVPDVEDRETRFRVFSEAAIGDYLATDGLPGDDVQTIRIEAFSPHFQDWADRTPATDEQVEAYLRSHVYWTWKYGSKEWQLSLSDCLRLHRSSDFIQRLVDVSRGTDWAVSGSFPDQMLKPSNALVQRLRAASGVITPSKPATPPPGEPEQGLPSYVFVDETRIADLRRLTTVRFDLRKLITLCEELNQCYRSQCYYAVAALTRAVIDHVPPIFEKRSFTEVANNYRSVGKSFRECMLRLDQSARDIGDGHLHSQVRAIEALPTRTQVNFSNDMDVLLGEIVSVLSSTPRE